MAKLLQLRRGTTSEHSSFAGAAGEVTVDTDKQTLVVHNGNGSNNNGVAVASTANPTFTGTVAGPTINASTALQIGGVAITSTAAELNILDGVTSTAAELNLLDGVTSTTAELNILDGVTSTAAELNILDGVTSTTAELNLLDGVTSTTAELNILDGVTSTAAELNILDGVTSTAAELNILDGVTSTTAELNILDGVTSTAAELNLVDGITAGTVTASKALIVDASKDLTGLNDVTIAGNLTVNGTTTTINSTTLKVDDKNIELGTVDTPSDTTADGGGITLKGASDKTILWTNSTDSWDFNQDIKTSGTVTDSKGDVRNIPASTNSTLVAADAGKHISITAGITINASTDFAIGDAVTIFNNQAAGNDETITATGIDLYLATDPSVSGATNRTLAPRGVATILCVAADKYVITGAGLS